MIYTSKSRLLVSCKPARPWNKQYAYIPHTNEAQHCTGPVVQKQCFFVLIYTPFSPWKHAKEYLQMQYCIWVVSCHACVQMQTRYIAGLSTHVFTKDVIMKQFRGTHTFLLICIIIPFGIVTPVADLYRPKLC